MKLTLIIDPNNKYQNRLYYGNKLIATGTTGLENTDVTTKGKRIQVNLSLTNVVEVLIESEACPELHHYDEIRKVIGNREGLQKLGYTCELLMMSPRACDGCPKHPDRSRRINPAGRDVEQKENDNGSNPAFRTNLSQENKLAS